MIVFALIDRSSTDHRFPAYEKEISTNSNLIITLDYHKIVEIFVLHFHKYGYMMTKMTIHPNDHVLPEHLVHVDIDHENNATKNNSHIIHVLL
jgi:hypothetical protein